MSDQPCLNTHTHRLTDLPGPKHPQVCQKCGWPAPGLGQTQGAVVLDRWQECDHHDRPERRVLVLCTRCSKRIIEPHPRLYIRLVANAPWPGCMPLCVDCRWREGVRCTHPQAKDNGGPGVLLTIAPPVNAMVDGTHYRGPMQLWPAPASACRQKEPGVVHTRAG